MRSAALVGGDGWRRGLYLAERTAGTSSADGGSAPGADRPSWVPRLIDLWRAEAGLQDDDDFARRLAADGLDAATFELLVAELDQPEPAADGAWWQDLLDEVLTAADSTTQAERNRLFGFLNQVPFGLVLWPFVRWAWRVYDTWLSDPDLTALVSSPDSLTGQFIEGLTEQLANCEMRVMSLELNIARLQGELTGDTPGERFSAFVGRFTELDEIRRLLAKYPVLGRLLATKVRYWVDATTEAMHRYVADRAALHSLIGADPGKVVTVRSTGSDPHRRGRRAFVFAFTDGTRVVYKSRSLAVDERFQEFVAWANAEGVTPALPVLRVVDRGTHGWQEFITAGSCATRSEVRDFYRRQGGYLALLYVLGATDFHRENLIAAGAYPYLVDLETLFHCHEAAQVPETAAYRAYRIAKDSVLATGLLPFFVSGADGESASDISGLGGAAGQLSVAEGLTWTGIGTDQMRAERAHAEMEGKDNRPTLDGADIRAEDFALDVLAGFERTYDLLARDRAALGERLRRFDDVPVRYVIRATLLYGLAREAGYHPDYLGNGLHRDRLLDRFWAGLSVLPEMARVMRAERADLLDDDVPYFRTTPSSRDLWDSRGDVLAGFFETATGMDVALARVERMGEQDRQLQSEFIKVSLGTGDRSHLALPARPTEGDPPDNADFLAAAVTIGDRLLETAIHGDHGDLTWLEPRWMGQERWQLGPADVGLYNGSPGIAYFLGYLGAVTGAGRFVDAADAAVASVEDMLTTPLGAPNGSAFLGRGAVIHLFTHLAMIRSDPRLLDRAVEEAMRLSVTRDTEVDILDGAAGTVVVLLGLYRATGDERVLDVAVRHGEHILERATRMPVGLGWPSALTPQPLAGLSHGAAGICWALATLAEAAGEPRFRAAAQEGLRYERTLFDPRRRNWRDLRNADTPDTRLPVSWCHGAPGIGITRLLCAGLVDHPHNDDEISIAIDTTLRHGLRQNESLCHGDFGNLELLLLAARHRGDDRLRALAYDTARDSYRAAHRRGRWLSGWGRTRDEAAGLLTGLAGTGLTLLRLASDLRVPSPLYLAPPGDPAVATAPAGAARPGRPAW